MQLWQFVCIYLLVINIITFIAFGLDKRKAKKDLWRTPKVTLLSLMTFGGVFGGYFGMKLFHHKTQKIDFKIWVWISLILLITAIVLLIKYYDTVLVYYESLFNYFELMETASY